MKNLLFSKIWPIIKHNRMLRTMLTLNIIMLVLIFVLTGVRASYGNRIAANNLEIEKNVELIKNFQLLVSGGPEAAHLAADIFQKKSFANFDEVIPFIAFLENLFYPIDDKANIIVKSRENQIFMDHFADYEVAMQIKADKEELYRALDELDDSRFITNLLRFDLDYKPVEDDVNQLKQIKLVIRLFLK